MKTKRSWTALIAVAVVLLIVALPTPPPIATADGSVVELSASGKASLGVLAMAVVLWMTETLAFPVTALLAVVALAVTGAGDFESVVKEGFGHEIVLFCIGVMIFAAAINRSGLLRRFTTVVLARVGHSPRMIILAVLAVGAAASMWISDMAVAAILMPIGSGILRDAKVRKLESNFGRALMIACAWGPLIGGIGTPAGCGPNPVTIGYLQELAGIEFSFGQWMVLGIPAAAIMIPCAWGTLLACFPLEELDLRLAEEDVQARQAELGPFSGEQAWSVAILGLAIILWVGRPLIAGYGGFDYLSISFVALACSLLFFLPRIDVLTWVTAQKEIDWGAIVLIMAGLSVGTAVYRTGAAQWVSTVAFSGLGAVHPIGQVFLVVLGVCLMKVMFSSNTLTGIIVVPLMIALSRQLEISPALLAIPAGITSSLSFILVTSAPANVILYAAGYFSIKDMAKAGLIMTLWASAAVTISVVAFGRFCGIDAF